jgi:hypothetical protein
MWSTFIVMTSPTLPVNGMGSLLLDTKESKMTDRAIRTTTLMCHVLAACENAQRKNTNEFACDLLSMLLEAHKRTITGPRKPKPVSPHVPCLTMCACSHRLACDRQNACMQHSHHRPMRIIIINIISAGKRKDPHPLTASHPSHLDKRLFMGAHSYLHLPDRKRDTGEPRPRLCCRVDSRV